MRYAEPEEMEKRFDKRTLGDLCLDNGEQQVNLASDDRLQQALDDASGAIDSACEVGKMYDPDDLANLTGNSGHLLKRMCCELALVYLIEARPEKFKGQYAELTKRTEGYLDRFRKGERVFSIDTNKDAGVVSYDGLDRYEYDQQNWLPDRATGYYPARVTRLPFGR